MTKEWVNIFRVIISLIGIIVIAFDAELYILCKQQGNTINTMSDQQKVELQVNSNKFKYQQDQIDHLSKDLEDAQQQVKDQKNALAGQKEEDQSIQTSLVDIKAEADAIKQDIKVWQKDYVSVLAEFAQKMDDSHAEIKNLENNLNSLNIPELKDNINSLKDDIEKMAHQPENSLPGTPLAPEKKDKNEDQS